MAAILRWLAFPLARAGRLGMLSGDVSAPPAGGGTAGLQFNAAGNSQYLPLI